LQAHAELFYVVPDSGNALTPEAFDAVWSVVQGTISTTFANEPGEDEYVSW
jgi:hypothetical protein